MFGAYVRFKCNYAAILIPWTVVDYWKYEENMTVNIITKEDIGLVK